MTNPTLATAKRDHLQHWLIGLSKINFSTRKIELQMEKIPVQRLILVWDGRCFCQMKEHVGKRSHFPFDQRAARREMEIYGWRKTQVYGYAAGREERFHQN